jgi:outer membrane protein insertion porin family
MVAARELIWWTVCSFSGIRRLPRAAELLKAPSPFIVIALVFFVAGVFGPAASGAADTYIGKRLEAVRFEPAEQPLLKKELDQKVAALKVGEPLRMEDVRAVVENLYASGRYENIQVDASLSPSGSGVIIKFITTDSYFVRDVEVNGVPEPPNEGQLVNATKLQLGTLYEDPQLKQAVENLMEVLRNNGFYLAKIDTDKTLDPATRQIDLIIKVASGKRARFDVPIIKGNPARPVDQVIRATGWKRFLIGGYRQLTESRVSSGLDRVRRSYQNKDFLKAKVTLEDMRYVEERNTAAPTLNVQGGPKVLITTSGAKVSKGKLRQLVPVFQEQSVDKDLLVEGQRNIAEYFQSKGYFEAQVEFDAGTEGPDQQNIDYAIAPGPLHNLVRIEILGNKYFDQETLRERMYMSPASFLRFRHGRYSQAYLKRDVEAIKDLYKSNGFRDVDVQYDVVDDYAGKITNIGVVLTIKEGPQWFVSKLELAGVDPEDIDQIRGMIHLTEGQPYSDYNVATDQDTILNYYFNSGYPKATFEAAVKESSTPYHMDVKFLLNPGERQYVRDVLISGLHTTNPQLVQDRIQNLDPGKPLSQSSMNESQRRLYDLGVFARVDTALQNPDGEEQYKYILYRIEEARRYSITGGIGAQFGRIGRGDISTLDTPAGTAGFSPRVSVGVTRSNLFGIGHTIGVQTRLSNIQKRAVLSYVAPQFKGNPDLNLTFSALYDDSRDVNTFNAKREEGSVQLGQRLTKANSIQYRLAYRRVSVDPNSLQITPALIPILSQPVQLGIISTTFIEDRRDDPGDAHKGIYNTIDAGFASSLLGSKTSFTRALGRNATYHRIGKELVFARSTNFGVLTKLSKGDVPLPERFFAGGASSHRGFAENQAGPRDTGSGVVINGQQFTGTGFPVGGKALLINTLELRFPLLGDNIGGVVFHDAGNVYTDLSKVSFRYNQKDLTDFDYMVHAIGFGIRYRTPIGPIRVDMGYALNPPSFRGLRGSHNDLLNPLLPNVQFVTQQLSHFQFHFSLGQAF